MILIIINDFFKNIRFPTNKAKEIIHNVMFDILSSKVYSVNDASKWTNQIADTIREKIKSKLKFVQITNSLKIILLYK